MAAVDKYSFGNSLKSPQREAREQLRPAPFYWLTVVSPDRVADPIPIPAWERGFRR